MPSKNDQKKRPPWEGRSRTERTAKEVVDERRRNERDKVALEEAQAGEAPLRAPSASHLPTTPLSSAGRRSPKGRDGRGRGQDKGKDKKESSKEVAKMGDAVHALVQSEFASRGMLAAAEPILFDKKNLLVSKLDAVMATGEVVEIKSASLQDILTMTRPRPEHVAQLLYYLKAAGTKDYGTLLYVARESPGVRKGFRVALDGTFKHVEANALAYMVGRRGETARPEARFNSAFAEGIRSYEPTSTLKDSYNDKLREYRQLRAYKLEALKREAWNNAYKQAISKAYAPEFVTAGGFSEGTSAAAFREQMTPFGSPAKFTKKEYNEAEVRKALEESLAERRTRAKAMDVTVYEQLKSLKEHNLAVDSEMSETLFHERRLKLEIQAIEKELAKPPGSELSRDPYKGGGGKAQTLLSRLRQLDRMTNDIEGNIEREVLSDPENHRRTFYRLSPESFEVGPVVERVEVSRPVTAPDAITGNRPPPTLRPVKHYSSPLVGARFFPEETHLHRLVGSVHTDHILEGIHDIQTLVSEGFEKAKDQISKRHEIAGEVEKTLEALFDGDLAEPIKNLNQAERRLEDLSLVKQIQREEAKNTKESLLRAKELKERLRKPELLVLQGEDFNKALFEATEAVADAQGSVKRAILAGPPPPPAATTPVTSPSAMASVPSTPPKGLTGKARLAAQLTLSGGMRTYEAYEQEAKGIHVSPVGLSSWVRAGGRDPRPDVATVLRRQRHLSQLLGNLEQRLLQNEKDILPLLHSQEEYSSFLKLVRTGTALRSALGKTASDHSDALIAEEAFSFYKQRGSPTSPVHYRGPRDGWPTPLSPTQAVEWLQSPTGKAAVKEGVLDEKSLLSLTTFHEPETYGKILQMKAREEALEQASHGASTNPKDIFKAASQTESEALATNLELKDIAKERASNRNFYVKRLLEHSEMMGQPLTEGQTALLKSLSPEELERLVKKTIEHPDISDLQKLLSIDGNDKASVLALFRAATRKEIDPENLLPVEERQKLLRTRAKELLTDLNWKVEDIPEEDLEKITALFDQKTTKEGGPGRGRLPSVSLGLQGAFAAPSVVKAEEVLSKNPPLPPPSPAPTMSGTLVAPAPAPPTTPVGPAPTPGPSRRELMANRREALSAARKATREAIPVLAGPTPPSFDPTARLSLREIQSEQMTRSEGIRRDRAVDRMKAAASRRRRAQGEMSLLGEEPTARRPMTPGIVRGAKRSKSLPSPVLDAAGARDVTLFDIETSIVDGKRTWVVPHLSEVAITSVPESQLAAGLDPAAIQKARTTAAENVRVHRSAFLSESGVNEILSSDEYDPVVRQHLDEGSRKELRQEYLRARKLMSQEEKLRLPTEVHYMKAQVEAYAEHYMTKGEDGTWAYKQTFVDEAKEKGHTFVDSYGDYRHSQKRLLEKTTTELSDAARQGNVLSGHNVLSFDLPTLETLNERYGVKPVTESPTGPVPARLPSPERGDVVLDTLRSERSQQLYAEAHLRPPPVGVSAEEVNLGLKSRYTDASGREAGARALPNITMGMGGATRKEIDAMAHVAPFDVVVESVGATMLTQAPEEEAVPAMQRTLAALGQRALDVPDDSIKPAIPGLSGPALSPIVEKLTTAEETAASDLRRSVSAPAASHKGSGVRAPTTFSSSSMAAFGRATKPLQEAAEDLLTPLQLRVGQVQKAANTFVGAATEVLQGHGIPIENPLKYAKAPAWTAIGLAGLGVASALASLSTLGRSSIPSTPIRPTSKVLREGVDRPLSGDDEPHRTPQDDGFLSRLVRRAMTDFGSGWRGMARTVSEAMKTLRPTTQVSASARASVGGEMPRGRSIPSASSHSSSSQFSSSHSSSSSAIPSAPSPSHSSPPLSSPSRPNSLPMTGSGSGSGSGSAPEQKNRIFSEKEHIFRRDIDRGTLSSDPLRPASPPGSTPSGPSGPSRPSSLPSGTTSEAAFQERFLAHQREKRYRTLFSSGTRPIFAGNHQRIGHWKPCQTG